MVRDGTRSWSTAPRQVVVIVRTSRGHRLLLHHPGWYTEEVGAHRGRRHGGQHQRGAREGRDRQVPPHQMRKGQVPHGALRALQGPRRGELRGQSRDYRHPVAWVRPRHHQGGQRAGSASSGHPEPRGHPRAVRGSGADLDGDAAQVRLSVKRQC